MFSDQFSSNFSFSTYHLHQYVNQRYNIYQLILIEKEKQLSMNNRIQSKDPSWYSQSCINLNTTQKQNIQNNVNQNFVAYQNFVTLKVQIHDDIFSIRQSNSTKYDDLIKNIRTQFFPTMNQKDLILSQEWNPIIPKSIDSTIEETIKNQEQKLMVYYLSDFLQGLANYANSLKYSLSRDNDKLQYHQLKTEYDELIEVIKIKDENYQKQLENVLRQENAKLDSCKQLKFELSEQCKQKQQQIDELQVKISQLQTENLELKKSIEKQGVQCGLNKTQLIINTPYNQQIQQPSQQNYLSNIYTPQSVQPPIQRQLAPFLHNYINQQQQQQQQQQQLQQQGQLNQLGQQGQQQQQQQQQSEIKSQSIKIIQISVIQNPQSNQQMQQTEYQKQRFSTNMPIKCFDNGSDQNQRSIDLQVCSTNNPIKQIQIYQNEFSLRRSEYNNSEFSQQTVNCVHCKESCPTYIQLPCLHRYHQGCLEELGKQAITSMKFSAQCICQRKISTRFYSKETQLALFSSQAAQIFTRYRQSYRLDNCQDCEFFYQSNTNRVSYCPNCLKNIYKQSF